jgi:hypothetical protein
MALLETVLLMAAEATAPRRPARSASPPLELLEFLADWSDEDAQLIDTEEKPADKPAAPKTPREARSSEAGAKSP